MFSVVLALCFLLRIVRRSRHFAPKYLNKVLEKLSSGDIARMKQTRVLTAQTRTRPEKPGPTYYSETDYEGFLNLTRYN